MIYDVVVIGAGVMGSAAAWALARSGTRVCLLERFEIGHQRGSSHGRSRVFRLSYPEPEYVEMAIESLQLWRDLETESGQELLITTGGFDAGPHIEDHARALDECGATFELMDGAEARRRAPAIAPDPTEPVLYQGDGGIVASDAAVATFVAEARRAGAELRERTVASALEPKAGSVIVALDTGDRIEAPVCVVTAGGWAKGLLATAGIDLPVYASRETVAFFNLPSEIFPTLVEWGDPTIYSLPSPGQGVKAGEHIAGPETNPDEEGAVNDESVERLSAWVTKRFPGAAPQAHHAETCIYTNTSDERFILERHDRIVVGSPCSGHGFKFAPLIGERLAALADD